MAMATEKEDLLQGTLDLLILRTLAIEPQHGWGIAQRIEQISRDVLSVTQGSLYPALYRLEDQGAIPPPWGPPTTHPPPNFHPPPRPPHPPPHATPAPLY